MMYKNCQREEKLAKKVVRKWFGNFNRLGTFHFFNGNIVKKVRMFNVNKKNYCNIGQTGVDSF